MSKSDSKSESDCLNVDVMRSLVKQYSELGQWTSALFWADAAAAAASAGTNEMSGDDVWLLASAMLARGEWHRAAHTITSRGLHRTHLLCIGVAARALLAAREPASVLSLIEECEVGLLEPKANDQTQNRALASVLVTRARACCDLDRREAAAASLAAALRADTACYEALDLLLERHALTPALEKQLLENLPIQEQLAAGEAAFVRAAYAQRVHRYHEPPTQPPSELSGAVGAVEAVRARTKAAGAARAQRLAAAGSWRAALRELCALDPWCCPEVRAACLVELRRPTDLFTFAHTLVDAYPHSWTAWFAVGCYYYLIGKNEFARRYLSKAKSFEPSAGCVWLAYGHSFAADNEHDQAMAAYFKASQLMPGCHLPQLYVGVECTLLNNVDMAEMFLAQAADLYPCDTWKEDPNGRKETGFGRVALVAGDAHVAHEAGAAAYAMGDFAAAERLFLRALALAGNGEQNNIDDRWACTLDALGHATRKQGRWAEALAWHERALSLRPRRAASLAAAGLCLALLRREPRAAERLHAALARAPDDAVALALLDLIVAALDNETDIPQFPFPTVTLSPAPPSTAPSPSPSPAPAPAPPATPTTCDVTNNSDMSMSFD